MTTRHKDFLLTHCRVCSKPLGRNRYDSKVNEKALSYLGVDVTSDNTDVHPQYFCNSCYLTAKRISSNGKSLVANPRNGFLTLILNALFVMLNLKVDDQRK
jgi:hypothetical protein